MKIHIYFKLHFGLIILVVFIAKPSFLSGIFHDMFYAPLYLSSTVGRIFLWRLKCLLFFTVKKMACEKGGML